MAGIACKATSDLTLEASFSRTAVDSSIPGTADEESAWNRDQVLMGFMVVF